MAIFCKISPGDGYCTRGQQARQFCYRLRTERRALGGTGSMRELPAPHQLHDGRAHPPLKGALRKRLSALCHPRACACSKRDD